MGRKQSFGYMLEFDAPTAEHAADLERNFKIHAFHCGAVEAYVATRGYRWFCKVEFDSEEKAVAYVKMFQDIPDARVVFRRIPLVN